MALDQLDTRVAAMNVSDLDVHVHLAASPMPELEWLIVSGLDHPGKLAHSIAMYEHGGPHRAAPHRSRRLAGGAARGARARLTATQANPTFNASITTIHIG